jgi:hypothetical protein
LYTVAFEFVAGLGDAGQAAQEKSAHNHREKFSAVHFRRSLLVKISFW